MNINNDYNLNLNNANYFGNVNSKKNDNIFRHEKSQTVQSRLRFEAALDNSKEKIEKARELLNNGKIDDIRLVRSAAENIVNYGI